MDDIEVVLTCPLGSKCSEVKDNKVHRCAWYIKLQGKNPQSEEIYDDWKCAMAWQPILAIETSQNIRGVARATESFRNESVRATEQLAQSALLQIHNIKDITPQLEGEG